MSTPTVYVVCDCHNTYEGMTKEQIIAAIAEATGNTPSNIDDAFITKIKELNANGQMQFWVGTTAEFNAIATKDANTFYILTDDDTAEDLDDIAAKLNGIISGELSVPQAANAANATNATNANNATNATNASNATYALNAASATNATNATNAEKTAFSNTTWSTLTANTVLTAGKTYEVKFSYKWNTPDDITAKRAIFIDTIFTVGTPDTSSDTSWYQLLPYYVDTNRAAVYMTIQSSRKINIEIDITGGSTVVFNFSGAKYREIK